MKRSGIIRCDHNYHLRHNIYDVLLCTYIVWANYLKYTRAIYNDQICGEQFQ